jgi:spermidine synthase
MISWKNFPGPFIAGKPLVRDEYGHLLLQFGPASVQSQMHIEDPLRLTLGYTRTLMGFLLFVPKPARITMIGLGGGSLPKYCLDKLPDARIDVVEISEDVIALRNRFKIPPDDARFRIYCADGADYIAARENSDDVIIVDGFDLEGQAPSLCTEAFYHNCYRALRNNGVMAVNLSENAKQHAGFIKRMRKCFADRVMVVAAEDCTNKVVFAIKQSADATRNSFSEKMLLSRAARLDKQHPIAFRQMVERMATNPHNPIIA